MGPFDAGLGCQRHYPSCRTPADPPRATAWGWRVARWAIVRVRGASMEPTLRDGDLLLVRVGRARGAGRLVVVAAARTSRARRQACRPTRRADGWWVERDNPREGVDSWVVGAVPETRRRGEGRRAGFGRFGASGRHRCCDTVTAWSPHSPRPEVRSVTDSDLPVDPVFALHRGGKIEMRSTARVRDREGLALAYTPGVARVSEAIAADPGLADTYTWRSHVVAVVSDGTAVLGLGDIGPLAALPVMEGKALLFKDFGGVDAVPIVLDTTDVDEIVETVVRLAPSFGGINLEDISAPRCFEIETHPAGAARHPGLPRRPARHGDRGAGRAGERRPADRPAAVRPARGGLRCWGCRRRGDEDPARGRASGTSRSVTARGSSTPDATTSTA